MFKLKLVSYLDYVIYNAVSFTYIELIKQFSGNFAFDVSKRVGSNWTIASRICNKWNKKK